LSIAHPSNDLSFALIAKLTPITSRVWDYFDRRQVAKRQARQLVVQELRPFLPEEDDSWADQLEGQQVMQMLELPD
jgi:hypothetical protein